MAEIDRGQRVLWQPDSACRSDAGSVWCIADGDVIPLAGALFSFDPFRVASFFESFGGSRDSVRGLLWAHVTGAGTFFVLVVGLSRSHRRAIWE